ncbi:MAG: radical SAM family heme chaperone HemW [Rhabdochlamydiaceae bacterium]|jgi:oxygen-independent coproporphyrinogen-3 oxidase
MLITGEEISLYFHIPFCTRKCPYCHFYVTSNKQSSKDLLLEALKQEWELQKEKIEGKKVISIYFGGGTPALFGPAPIQTILSWISIPPHCEITLEANPEEITFELMQAYKAAGINRVSIGVQSLDNDLLKILGRTHNAEKALSGIEATYKAGLTNISIDLMYEIPHQSLSVWKKTLSQLNNLPIKHLSLYNLTIEPDTLFFKKSKKLTPHLPSSDACLEMLNLAVTELEKVGLYRYEISAFSQEGYQSCHNTGYWQGRPFLGFGPSAFSYWEGSRFRNIAHLQKYADRLQASLSPLISKKRFPPQLSKKSSLLSPSAG